MIYIYIHINTERERERDALWACDHETHLPQTLFDNSRVIYDRILRELSQLSCLCMHYAL